MKGKVRSLRDEFETEGREFSLYNKLNTTLFIHISKLVFILNKLGS